MNDQMNTPMSGAPTSFLQVWMNALTKPTEQTFTEMASSPKAKSTTAFLWIFITSLIQLFLISLVQGAYMREFLQQSGFGGRLGSGLVSRLIVAVCGAPILAVITVVSFAIFVGVVQFIAKMFGGRGTFDQLAYALAAITAPFSLISGVLGLFGAIRFIGLCFGLVSILLGFYALFLEILAVKAVNQFGFGQAVGALLLPFIVLCCCLSVGVIGIMRALGPRINDVFNSINQQLR